MREKIESASRQAAEARNRGLECADQHMKEEWAKVARMWEELANEYRQLEKEPSRA